MPLCQTSFPVACLSMHTAPVRLQGVFPSMPPCLHAAMPGSVGGHPGHPGHPAEKWKNATNARELIDKHPWVSPSGDVSPLVRLKHGRDGLGGIEELPG